MPHPQSSLCDIELVITAMMGCNFKLLHNDISFLLPFSFIACNELQPAEGKAAMTSNFLQLGCENNTYHTLTVALFESGQKQTKTKETLAEADAWQLARNSDLVTGFPLEPGRLDQRDASFECVCCQCRWRPTSCFLVHLVHRVRLHISSSADLAMVVLCHNKPIAGQNYGTLVQMLCRQQFSSRGYKTWTHH